ncbi:N-terminal domain of molybdenum-binding protein, putative transcriptional regulator ModE [Sulfurovum sp. enrichment culture clone C5]|uniref:N-terminal domain of molybdenum-binding protein, putative transcriptional regulator ModE n=1 Tax=Sulfurovum sp. enrichment culture clone C5 TaxID=497650 RepID=A0A0S4XMT7_9BACT|nr:N-terminal domain of molybdenum-binding protein, putative transcriptional regulator ModE [Sulfurovum sp. enrichment culture clone C5]
MIELDGRFWLNVNGKAFLGGGRVELLKKIDEIGSIHSASKAMKMSYKAAWDTLKQMSELSKEPLLDKQIGGKGGGGTKLTPYAKEMIATFEKFDKLHREFINRFKEAGDSPAKLQAILNRTFLTTSARNQFLCDVVDIKSNDISSKITLSFKEKTIFISTITTKSLQNMGIQKGQNIYAIIKSNDIKITNSLSGHEGNAIKGKVSYVNQNENGSEIGLKTDDDFVLVALNNTNEVSNLIVGMEAYGVFGSENILIGI